MAGSPEVIGLGVRSVAYEDAGSRVGVDLQRGRCLEAECHGRYIFALLFHVVIIRCDKMARDRGIVHMINARANIT